MSITSVGRALAIEEDLEDHLRNVDDQTSCLLVLEVENTSTRQAFEAVLTGSDAIGAKVKERIEPNTTVNLILPISKIRLSEEQTRQAIPALGHKQFVVGKGFLPLQELERFWYREELLRNIQLDWREVGSRRSGACNVRHLSLSDEMLAAIKLGDLPLTVEVLQDGEACSQDDKDKWSVPEGAFVEMKVSVKNLKARSLTLLASIEVEEADETVNLQDYRNADVDAVKRNVIMDGVPVTTVPVLEAGSELEESLSYSLCFMSRGVFSIKVRLEEVVEQGMVSEKTTSSPSIPKARVKQSVQFNVS